MIPDQIFGYEVNKENVALAFTLLFIVICFLHAFWGFLRGRRKSIFYLIMSLIIFGVGFALMNPIINFTLKSQMASMASEISSLTGYSLSGDQTYAEGVMVIIKSVLPEEIGAYISLDSSLGAIIYGLLGFVMKIVYIIVLIVLAFTVYKLFIDILWLIVRPRKKSKRRKTFGSRMGGFFIGAIKGACYSLLLFGLIAGIVSIGMSVKNAVEEIESPTAVVVLTDQSATLVEVANGANPEANELLEILDLLSGYEDSIPAKLFDLIKIKSVPLDEFCFDAVFSLDVKEDGEEKTTVKFRKELVTVANAIASIQKVLNLSMDNLDLSEILDKIANATPEQIASIKGVVDDLTQLDLIKVVVPAAIEVVLTTDYVKDVLPEGTVIDAKVLSDALLHDIATVGYTLVDAASLINTIMNGTDLTVNDYLNLDPSIVKTIFDEDHLGGIESLDVLAPVAITYITSMDDIKEQLETFGIDITAIGTLEEGQSWADEIKNLGDVYEIIQNFLRDPETGEINLDFNNFDLAALSANFNEENVDSLVETLFNSHLIASSVTGIIRTNVNNYFGDYLTISEDYVFDKDELSCLLKAVAAVLGAGILDKDEDGNIAFLDNAAKLDTDTIQTVAHYLASSKLLMGAIDDAIAKVDLEEISGLAIRIASFDGWTDPEKAETELLAILNSAKAAVKVVSKMQSSEGFSIDLLAELSLDDFDKILSSQVMMGTVVNFLTDNAKEGEMLEIVSSGVNEINKNPSEWYDGNKLTEKYSLTETGITISPLDLDRDVENLVDAYLVYLNGKLVDYAYITDSKTVSVNLEYSEDDIIEVYGICQGELRDVLMIVYNFASKMVDANVNFDSENLLSDLVGLVSEDNVIDITRSKFIDFVLCDALYNYLISTQDYINTPKELEDVDNPGHIDPYKWIEQNETYNILMFAVKAKAGIDFNNISMETIKLKPILDNKEYLFKSTFAVGIVRDLVGSVEMISVPDIDELKTIEGWKKELNTILDIATTIIEVTTDTTVSSVMDLVNLDDLTNFINAKDVLLKSYVLTETAKNLLIENTTELFTIPEDLKTAGLDVWGNTYDDDGNILTRGELQHLLDVFALIIPEGVSLENLVSSIKIGGLVTDEAISAISSSRLAACLVKDNVGALVETLPTELTEETAWTGEGNEIYNLLTALQVALGSGANDLTIDNISEVINCIDFDALLSKDNRTKIVASLLLIELVKEKIGGLINETPETIDSFDEWKGADGEVAKILAVLEIAIKDASSISLDNLNDIGSIVDFNALINPINSNTICACNLIVEFLREKLTEAGVVESLPAELSTYDSWAGENGEVSSILGILHLVIPENSTIDISDLSNITSLIDFSGLLDTNNTHTIVSSLFVVQLVREKLLGASLLSTTPESLQAFDDWKGDNGEVANILHVLSLLVANPSSLSLDNLSNITEIIDIAPLFDSSNVNTLISSTFIVALLKDKIGEAGLVEQMPSSLTEFSAWEGENGETAHILNVLSLLISDASSLTLDSLGDITTLLDFSALLDKENTNTIVASTLIVALVKEKIGGAGLVENLPSSLNEFSAWEGSNGEVAHILNVLSILITNSSSLTLDSLGNITELLNIGALFDSDNTNTIVASTFIVALVKEKIGGAGLVEHLPSSLDEFSAWEGQNGETAHILNVLSLLITDASSLTLDSISDVTSLLDFGALLDSSNTNTVVSSKFIVALFKEKIGGAGLVEELPDSLDEFSAWEGSEGETAHILNVLSLLITDPSSLSLDNLTSITSIADFGALLDNKNTSTVVSSLLIVQLVREKLLGASLLSATPESLQEFDNWKGTNGEVAHILGVLDILISDKDSISLETLSNVTSSINFGALLDNKNTNTIVASTFIVALFKDKITDANLVTTLPTSLNSFSAWEGSNGEVAHILSVLNILITDASGLSLSNLGDITAQVSFANMLNPENTNTIVSSDFIVALFKDKITSANLVSTLPSTLNSFSAWEGENGEVANILGVLNILIADTSGLSLSNLSDITAQVSFANMLNPENTSTIVSSDFIVALFKDKITDANLVTTLPSSLDEFSAWDGESGEVAHILSVLNILIANKDGLNLSNMSSITSSVSFANLLDKDNTETIISSTFIVALFKEKIEDANIVTDMPYDLTAFSAWETSDGELAKLLGVLRVLISNPSALSLDNMSSITNQVSFANLLDSDNTNTIISSTLIVELLKEKIIGANIVTDYPNTLNSLSSWTGESGEAARILTSLGIIISNPGDLSLTNLTNITSSVDFGAMIDDDNINDVIYSQFIVALFKEKIIGANLVTHLPVALEDFDNWEGTTGEVSRILRVLNRLIDDPSELTINNLGNITTNINFANLLDADNTYRIVSSRLIVELFKEKLDDANLVTNLPSSLEAFDNWYGSGKETANILSVLRILVANPNLLSLTDLSGITNQLSFASMINPTNTNTIVSSTYIVALFKEKIEDANLISTTPTTISAFSAWEGTSGETANILRVLNVLVANPNALSLTDLSGITNQVSFANLVNPVNNNTITSSDFIVELVREKITGASLVTTVPNGLGEFSNWNGSSGEASRLLNALYYVLGNDASSLNLTNLTNVTSKVHLAALVGEDRNEIIASLMLAEMIKEKVVGFVNYVPAGLSNVNGNLTGWISSNTYEGELTNLLASIGILLDPDEDDSIDDLNLDSMKLYTVVSQRNDILRSSVVTQLIMEKISDVSSINIPTYLVLTSQTGWKNTYNGETITFGELSYLLNGLGKLLGLSSTSTMTLDNISVDVNLYNVISNCDEILHSEIMSLTIQNKLTDLDMLTKPHNWDLEGSANYIIWSNSYSGDEVTYTGEIHKIFMAIDKLVDVDEDTSLDDLSSFDYANIFNEDNQATIFESRVVSETVIVKILGISALSIPENHGFTDQNDRSAWTTELELRYFFRSLNVILPEDAKSELNVSSSLGASSIYDVLANQANRLVILQSYVMSETLADNFKDSLSSNIPLTANAGINLNEASNWYGIDSDRNVDQTKELWCLIDSLTHIIGNSGFSSTISIDIDEVLNNSYFMPTLDSSYNNTNSAIHDLFNSKIIEEMFVSPVQTVISDSLSDMLTAPSGGYSWYRYTSSVEHDLQTILESIFLLEGKDEDDNSLTGLDYTNMSVDENTITHLKPNGIADAYCVSRTFRGSIEKSFTKLFKNLYVTLHSAAMVYKPVEASAIDSWSDLWFAQISYEGLSRTELHDLLANNINTVITNIESIKALAE